MVWWAWGCPGALRPEWVGCPLGISEMVLCVKLIFEVGVGSD